MTKKQLETLLQLDEQHAIDLYNAREYAIYDELFTGLHELIKSDYRLNINQLKFFAYKWTADGFGPYKRARP